MQTPQFPLLSNAEIVQILPTTELVKLFKKLLPKARRLAVYGISRYVYFCSGLDILPDREGFVEIIHDARNGESIAMDNERDRLAAKGKPIELHKLNERF